MASKLSQLFRGKNRNAKLSTQTSQGVEDDEEGYQDPIESCPTEPPTRIPKAPIPSYPPPRPSSPKARHPVRRDDYQDPWDSKAMRTASTGGGGDMALGKKPPGLIDTYQNPYDSRMNSSKEDYADPFDAKMQAQIAKQRQQSAAEEDADCDYDEPYEQSINKPAPILNDTYEDPWDTRQKLDIAEGKIKDRPKSGAPPPPTQGVNVNRPTPGMNINRPPQQRKDDYSDPWDSRTSGSLTTDEYDDTYSEPYDKGKSTILDESRRKPVAESPVDDDDIYDMPYEEKVMIGIAQKPNNPGIPNFRQPHTKLETPQRVAPKPPAPFVGTVRGSHGTNPASPPPPMDSGGDYDAPWEYKVKKVGGGAPPPPAMAEGGDYDSPWEWKVSKMQQDFEKRFSVGENARPVVAPRKPPQSRNSGVPPHANPIPKPQRVNPPPPAPPMTQTRTEDKEHEVDPTIPLDNQGWFHGHIRRGEAESLLHNQPDCSYLIRNSESSKIDFSLSLRNRGAPMHLKISYKNGQYILGINSRPYDTIPEMIHHYSLHMLNIKGAEHVKLKYPVFKENLYFTVEPGS